MTVTGVPTCPSKEAAVIILLVAAGTVPLLHVVYARYF